MKTFDVFIETLFPIVAVEKNSVAEVTELIWNWLFIKGKELSRNSDLLFVNLHLINFYLKLYICKLKTWWK